MKATLLDVHMDLLRAQQAVMALEERLASGEAIDEAEFDAAMAPFNECLGLSKDKTDDYIEYLLFRESAIPALDKILTAAKTRKKAEQSFIDRMKRRAMFVINCTDANYLEGHRLKMYIQRNSEDSLAIKHEDMLPESCFKMVRVVDSDAVREGIRRGEIMPSVAELTRGEHLRIK